MKQPTRSRCLEQRMTLVKISLFCILKIHQIPYVIFQTKSQIFFKVWITFQCHDRQFFCSFLAETF